MNQYSKSGSMFSSSKQVEASSDCHRLRFSQKYPVFVLAGLTSASRAGELSQELGS